MIEFLHLEPILQGKVKNVSKYSLGRFKSNETSILNIFECNHSFRTEEHVFDQNFKTLIFTFAPPLQQCE